MSVRLAVTLRALAQAEAAQDWWTAHRSAAAELFEAELRTVLERIVVHPDSGVPYPHPRVAGVRRALMRRTRHHVFYRFDESADAVLVVAVWGAARGEPPRLDQP